VAAPPGAVLGDGTICAAILVKSVGHDDVAPLALVVAEVNRDTTYVGMYSPDLLFKVKPRRRGKKEKVDEDLGE
jgi:hypothetical protein